MKQQATSVTSIRTRIDDQRSRPSVEFARDVFNAFLRVDAFGLAKQVAFSVLFALLPIIFVLVSIGALIERYLDVPVASQLREYVVEESPPEAQEILLAGVDQAITKASTPLASVSALVALLLAIWGGMGGIGALIEATNRAHGVRNTKAFHWRRLVTLALTLLFSIMVILTIGVAFFSGKVVDKLAEWFGHHDLLAQFGELTQVILSIAVTFLVLFVLYMLGPDLDHAARWAVPGTTIGTVGWVMLLQLFSIVAARVPYQNVYGAASAAIILLYFLNVAGIIFILGAVINGVVGERYDTRRARDLEAHPEKLRYVGTNAEQTSDAL